MLRRKHISDFKAAVSTSKSQFESKKKLLRKVKGQYRPEKMVCECPNSNYKPHAQHVFFVVNKKKYLGFGIHV